MDRQISYVFIFVIIALFVLEASSVEHIRILWAVAFGLSLSFIAFLFKWLSLDGAQAAGTLGVITYGFGSIEAAVILLLFFITGSFLSEERIRMARPEWLSNPRVDRLDYGIRRNSKQVWANGFWLALGLCIWFVDHNIIYWLAAISSLAVATADTWSTELGIKNKEGRTHLITTLEQVKPGTDGGISINGTAAALIGSALIGLISAFFYPEYAFVNFIIVTVTGFTGALLDSVYGALYQYKEADGVVRVIKNYLTGSNEINNDVVNTMATGSGFIIALLLGILLI